MPVFLKFGKQRTARAAEVPFGEDGFLEIEGWVIHIDQLTAQREQAQFPQ